MRIYETLFVFNKEIKHPVFIVNLFYLLVLHITFLNYLKFEKRDFMRELKVENLFISLRGLEKTIKINMRWFDRLKFEKCIYEIYHIF